MAGQNCQFGYATEHIATTLCTEIVPWTSFFLEKKQSLGRLTCYKFLLSVVCHWPVEHSGSFLGVPKPARNVDKLWDFYVYRLAISMVTNFAKTSNSYTHVSFVHWNVKKHVFSN
jgi:hypothetical protein